MSFSKSVYSQCNAFNATDRQHVAKCIEEVVPELQAFFKFELLKVFNVNILYENDVILTTRGLQQGASDAPMGFRIHKLLHAVKSKFKNVWNSKNNHNENAFSYL